MHNGWTASKHRRPGQHGLGRAGFLAAAAAASLALGGWAAFGSGSAPAAAAAPLRLGVPAYVFPGQSPLAALGSLSPAPGIVILNPGSGDAPFSPPWQAQARRLRARGITVLGYVHTDGATRPLTAAEVSIRNYLGRPGSGVSGIFLDEMSDACAAVPYYEQLAAYIRGLDRTAFIAANPGEPVTSCFLAASPPVAATYVTFEHDAASYAADFRGNVVSPAGAYSLGRRYPAASFWHLIYDARPAQLGSLLGLAASRHAGYVYATDGSLPNPWDTVASYLGTESRAAGQAARHRQDGHD